MVLEKRCLKKLRNILLSNYLYICLILFVFLYCSLRISIIINKSKYSIFDTKITGYIYNYFINENKITIYLKGKEKIICNYYFKDDDEIYQLGDEIYLEGIMEHPNKNTIFNGFNYKEYLKYEGINYIFNVSSIKKIKDNKKIRYKLKNYIINKIEESSNKDYLYTFILGNNKYINNTIMNSYRSNGISHLFSISGMHVSLLSLIILKIFKNFKFKELIIIIFILIYIILTNFSPSILRAGLLYILCFINKKFKFKIPNYKIMILLLFICILIDPYIIKKIGFLYSYVISFYLILFNKLITKKENKIYKLFIVSFIALMVSLPITINNFFEINLLGIILNIIFVPFLSSIIFPLSVITFFLPIFNPIFSILINWFEVLSLFFANIKIFTITMCKMSDIFIIIYYVFITLSLCALSNNNYKYLFLLFFIIFIHNNIQLINKNFEITFIDVNQGDSSFIKFPNNKLNILIDTGMYKGSDIIKYLKSIGIKKLNYLILTHGDFDHMGEAINLVNNFNVEKVIFNCGSYNDLEKELIKVLDKKKIKYYSCIKELNIDNNKLYFLQTKEYDNENDNSNVIYTELDGYKFMFMGDASSTTEKEILNIYNLHEVDVLKVGHHGSKTSSGKEFINEINPKYSIISVGKNNRYGHPNKEALENLKESKIYRTDIDGSIMFKIQNNKLKIETCSP